MSWTFILYNINAEKLQNGKKIVQQLIKWSIPFF